MCFILRVIIISASGIPNPIISFGPFVSLDTSIGRFGNCKMCVGRRAPPATLTNPAMPTHPKHLREIVKLVINMETPLIFKGNVYTVYTYKWTNERGKIYMVFVYVRKCYLMVTLECELFCE